MHLEKKNQKKKNKKQNKKKKQKTKQNKTKQNKKKNKKSLTFYYKLVHQLGYFLLIVELIFYNF